MGSVHSYSTKSGKRYIVRYFKPDRTHGAKRGFKTKREAEQWLYEVENRRTQGTFVDPQASRITVDALGEHWLSAKRETLKPSSYAPVETAWRLRVQPTWGNWPVGDIRYTDIRSWVAALRREAGATVVIRTYGVLAGILDDAVRDERIQRNPARLGDVGLPKKIRGKHGYLTHREVQRLARAAGDRRTLVLVLAYTGIRWAEATALRVSDLDFPQRRLHVVMNAVEVHGEIHVGTPKSNRARVVPVPAFVMEDLRRLTDGRTGKELVFPGRDGGYMRRVRSSKGSKSWFAAALRAADLPAMTIHDLRHTAASLAVASGAHVKTIQRMLGHMSAAMTLDVYSDLFDHDLDAVSNALDAAARSADASPVAYPGATSGSFGIS